MWSMNVYLPKLDIKLVYNEMFARNMNFYLVRNSLKVELEIIHFAINLCKQYF